MGSITGGGPAHTKAIHVQSMTGDVLLRLEHDDVHFRSEHASQHHKSTQTDRYAHGRGLDLGEKEMKNAIHFLPLTPSIVSMVTPIHSHNQKLLVGTGEALVLMERWSAGV